MVTSTKSKLGIYKDDGNGWLEIKNRAYSQAEGRHELLTRENRNLSVAFESAEIVTRFSVQTPTMVVARATNGVPKTTAAKRAKKLNRIAKSYPFRVHLCIIISESSRPSFQFRNGSKL
jgi:hypothetical protein